MKTTWIITTVGAVLCLALGVTGMASRRTAADLRRDNQALLSELQTTRGRAESLATEKQEAARQLALVANRHSELTSRLADLEAAEAQESAMATSSAAMKPYKAEAYLGRKSLGLVWIVPRNLRMDTNSQRYVYEPVVCLDERLRKFFEVHHTNIVEQMVETPVYDNNNYYPEPYYYYPAYYHGGKPTNSVPPAQPQPPPTFNPGSGTIIKQPIGTPAERIKTYPSAPRLPSPNSAPKQPQLRPPPTTRTASL